MRLLGLMTGLFVGVAMLSGCPSSPPVGGADGGGNDCANGNCPPDASAPGPDAGRDAGNDGGIPCNQGDPPKACGKTGSSCTQACVNGVLGVCQPPSGAIDTQTDPQNCGECGNMCPTPMHSQARCVKGICGRGPCEAGWFDFDRETKFGCEVTCTGTTCTNPDGTTITLTAPPLPESGLVFQALASTGSTFNDPQTNATHTHYGVMGESTPPGAGGVIEMKNDQYKNVGGFMAIDRK